MKKSVLSYAFLFSLGQILTPWLSYANQVQYSNDESPSSTFKRTGKAEPSEAVLAERARQGNGMYAGQNSTGGCKPGSSLGGGNICYDNVTQESTGQVVGGQGEPNLSPPEPRGELSNGNQGAAGNGGGATPSSGAPEPGELDPQNKYETQIHQNSQLLQEAVREVLEFRGSLNPAAAPSFNSIYSLSASYAAQQESCASRQAKAASVCLESTNSDLADTMANLNLMMSTLGAAAVKDSCSTFAKAMEVAKAGMSAYTSACGAMKAGCSSSCVSAKATLEKINSAAVALMKSPAICPPDVPNTPPTYASCMAASKSIVSIVSNIRQEVERELKGGDIKAVAGKASVCVGKYAKLLSSGALGVLSLANSMKQGQNCDKAADGTGTGETDACKVAATANTEACLCKVPTAPACICLKNPRTPGCASGIAEANQGGPNSYAGLGANDKTNLTGKENIDLGGFNKPTFELGDRNPTSEASGAAPPTGGGSAGLGGGGGSGGGSGGGDAAAKKGLNANILGGTGGGGGGGGWSGGAGGSGANSKYRSYLPGGDKDPNKLAGQQAWTKEVTGQGGKSNWEKVKDRYRDNKNTLLNN